MLAGRFGDIWVEGEVSNLRTYPSGHLYFALKDEESQIDAVCFRSAARLLKFELEDGLQVVGRGRLDLYVARGKYQLVLEAIEPKGRGARQFAFEKLKKKLAAEGLFAAERKKPLPVLPQLIGVVTSPVGAALQDMLRTMRLHGAKARVILYPCQVQGDEAAGQIAAGIAYLSDCGGVDVIIAGRGGGSIEDLWPFNEEVVARAIAASSVPVVSGVGHETDFTIADFVADVRAATPTAAAQLVAKGWEELVRRLEESGARLVQGLEQMLLDRENRLGELVRHRAFEVVRARLAEARHRAERQLLSAERGLRALLARLGAVRFQLSERLGRKHPISRLLRQRARVGRLADGLERNVGVSLRQRQGVLGGLGAKLETLSPLASLSRGYSICRKPDGSVVTAVGQTAAGDRVGVLVTDGEIGCRVLDTRRGKPAGGS